MFGKLAADALGLSDIGQIIKPQDYDKADSDDYLMQEEGERIFFLIKSKSDEYCFTNLGLIHLDGTSAMSKKRLLKRFSYSKYRVQNVCLETAGTVDLDIEVKFLMGENQYSIDVNKKQLESLKDLYKALVKISELQYDNAQMLQYSQQSLSTATEAMMRNQSQQTALEQFQSLNEYSFGWLKEAHKQYLRKDYGDVFEKFINN